MMSDRLVEMYKRFKMPSKSKKQHDTMQAAAHSEKFAKKVGIPQDVAQEFVDADKKAGKYKAKKK
jgi:hypothetical protein